MRHSRLKRSEFVSPSENVICAPVLAIVCGGEWRCESRPVLVATESSIFQALGYPFRASPRGSTSKPSVGATPPRPVPSKCCSCLTSCCASAYLAETSARRLSWSASLSSTAVNVSASLEALTFSFIHISFACPSSCSRSFSFNSSCSTLSLLDLPASLSLRRSRSAASSRWLRCPQRVSSASTSGTRKAVSVPGPPIAVRTI
mmetsp:Transcript_28893/g.62812  ORF Transcript_28893/g.62812 Transcript_28893/m.62812 type:complete len:203 (-) Transcript_28893:435-1043(-)